MHIDFVKAGRHFYTVNFDDEFYLHRAVVRNREEKVVKSSKKNIVK